MNLNNYSYSYIAGTNKLQSITNAVNQQTKNYGYDEIGNTVTDEKQGVTNGVWNVYGKLKSLTNKDGKDITYTYDATGQRISKQVGEREEWYIKDASGNTMATYKKDASINSGYLSATGFYKYGSSLLSIKSTDIDLEVQQLNGNIQTYVAGSDGYILTDQSGNTRVIVSDKKLQHSSDGITVDFYTADIRNANYYSTYGAISKAYGAPPVLAFNGQRKSTEISADAQTAEFWEYNGDVGRRWNVDPRPTVGISDYSTFFNNPNLFSDLLDDTGRPRITLVSPSELMPKYNLRDQNYVSDLNRSTNQNKNPGTPLFTITGALTLGAPGTFAFEGKVVGVKVGVSQSINEMDALSIRENNFYGAGKNIETGDKERRSGFGVGILAYGTEKYGEVKTDKSGKKNQVIKQDYNVPLLTLSKATDERGKVNSKFSTPIVHIKLGFIIGAELGVKLNYPESTHVAIPPRTNYEISESTSIGVPKLIIYKFK